MFQELLHFNHEKGIQLYEELQAEVQDFCIDDFMNYTESRDCEFLIAEAYQATNNYHAAMHLYEKLLSYEKRRPVFHHFVSEIRDRLKKVYIDCLTNPKNLENIPNDRKRREEILKRLRAELFSSMTEGDLKESIRIYESFMNKSSIEEFYEKILNPTMEKIGSMWADGRLSIATEHVSSNTAQSLIKIISENHKRSTLDKGKVIITTPVGEEHCLSCNMIESLLLSKGFTTFNLSPSTPANSCLLYTSPSPRDATLSRMPSSA